ncbi:MAG: hypothetical protein RIF41_20170 [Polyangiaceae bacterium]
MQSAGSMFGKQKPSVRHSPALVQSALVVQPEPPPRLAALLTAFEELEAMEEVVALVLELVVLLVVLEVVVVMPPVPPAPELDVVAVPPPVHRCPTWWSGCWCFHHRRTP